MHLLGCNKEGCESTSQKIQIAGVNANWYKKTVMKSFPESAFSISHLTFTDSLLVILRS